MAKNKKKKKTQFWKSSGIITLFATLIGVFLALYLNEWTTSRKEKKQKEIATENILLEINSNKEKLEESVDNYTKMLDLFIFFDTHVITKVGFVAHPHEISALNKKHPGIIEPVDSIKVADGRYNYRNMNLNLELFSEQVELRTIAWQTLKNNNIISSFNFDYLMSLEYIYNSISLISQTNAEINNNAKLFVQSSEDILDNLIFDIKLAIQQENDLINLCDKTYEQLSK